MRLSSTDMDDSSFDEDPWGFMGGTGFFLDARPEGGGGAAASTSNGETNSKMDFRVGDGGVGWGCASEGHCGFDSVSEDA